MRVKLISTARVARVWQVMVKDGIRCLRRHRGRSIELFSAQPPPPPPFTPNPHYAYQSSPGLRLQILEYFLSTSFPPPPLSGKPLFASKTEFVMSSKEKPGSPTPPSQEPKDENEDDEEEINLMKTFMSGDKTFYSPLPPVKPTPLKSSGSRKRKRFSSIFRVSEILTVAQQVSRLPNLGKSHQRFLRSVRSCRSCFSTSPKAIPV